jgi:hypothetical protein
MRYNRIEELSWIRGVTDGWAARAVNLLEFSPIMQVFAVFFLQNSFLPKDWFCYKIFFQAGENKKNCKKAKQFKPKQPWGVGLEAAAITIYHENLKQCNFLKKLRVSAIKNDGLKQKQV